GAALALHAGRGAACLAGAGGVSRPPPGRARVPDRTSLPPERPDHEPAARRAGRGSRARARLSALRDRERALLRSRLRSRAAAHPRALLAARATAPTARPGPLRGCSLRRLRAPPAPARPADRAARRAGLGRARARGRLGRAPGAVLRLVAVALDAQAGRAPRPAAERRADRVRAGRADARLA